MVDANIDIPTARLDAFCQRYQIQRLALFGSVLREDFRPDSDVDILVTFKPERFCNGLTKEDFAKDELRQSAVLQKLIVIGEAVAQLPNNFTANYPDIEWRDIKAFRNFAVHAYFFR